MCRWRRRRRWANPPQGCLTVETRIGGFQTGRWMPPRFGIGEMAGKTGSKFAQGLVWWKPIPSGNMGRLINFEDGNSSIFRRFTCLRTKTLDMYIHTKFFNCIYCDYVYKCIWLHIHIWKHVYVCMISCMYVCMYAWMYVCMYVCMHACKNIFCE